MSGDILKEAIDDYLLAGLARGWSRATHRVYRSHLTAWRLWLDNRAVMRLDQITPRLLRAWGAGLRYQQWPPPTAERAPEVWQAATVRSAIKTVKTFLAWCREEGMLTDDLSGVLKSPKPRRRAQRSLRPEEVLELLAATRTPPARGVTPDQAAAVGLRNAAIVLLLYDSLLRAAELCRLRVADVDLERRVLIVEIKGGSQARARFGVETADRLRDGLAVRSPAAGVETLFVSIAGNTPGQPLTTTGLRIILAHLGERAGLPHVTPHAFRRGGAVAAIQAGAPTRAVQEFGRWSNVSMVELYTRALDTDAMYDEYCPVDLAVQAKKEDPGAVVAAEEEPKSKPEK